MRSILICLVLLLGSSGLITAQTNINTTENHCRPICEVGDRPACELAWASHVSAVFLGTVADIAKEKVPIILNGKQEMTFKLTVTVMVDESFIGVKDKKMIVVSGGDLCGYNFVKDRRYLIYAKHEADGRYFTSRCSGTKIHSRAGDDLKYLRSLASASRTATIFGSVFQFTQPVRDDFKAIRPMRPWKGGKVTINGELQTFMTVVEEDGTFRLSGLPPGNYKVDINVNEPTTVTTATEFAARITGQGQEVVAPAMGCSKVDFLVDPFAKK